MTVQVTRASTADPPRRCDGCRLWSEKIAESRGGGPVVAMCLNDNAPDSRKMVYLGCGFYEAGDPIDLRW